MPNFKLSGSIRQHIKDNATHLADRRVSQAQTGFPLTVDEIQRAMVPAETLDLFRRLDAAGVGTISKFSEVAAVVPPMAGSPRPALLSITVAPRNHVLNPVFLIHHHGYYEIAPQVKRGAILPSWQVLDVSVLTAGKRKELAKWTANLVQEYRLANLAKATVGWFVDNYAETTGHVLARWPGLIVLVSDATWKQKFRDAPRSLRRWEWGFGRGSAEELADYEKHKKAMALTDVVFAGASLLPNKFETVYPSAVIHEFGRIDGDKD